MVVCGELSSLRALKRERQDDKDVDRCEETEEDPHPYASTTKRADKTYDIGEGEPTFGHSHNKLLGRWSSWVPEKINPVEEVRRNVSGIERGYIRSQEGHCRIKFRPSRKMMLKKDRYNGRYVPWGEGRGGGAK